MTTTPLAPTRPSIEAAGPWRRTAVAGVLADAFADDPVFTWIEPDPVALATALPVLFEAFAVAYSRHRAPDLASVLTRPAGAALWVPPGVEPVHPDDAEALDHALDVLSPEAQTRTAACLKAFAAVHPHEPAWYLNFLGVRPDHQGRGVGSALLRAVLDGCDLRGEPAYLEATSERNRALYERHGFRLLREIPLPDGPTSYAMGRNPIMPPSWPSPCV